MEAREARELGARAWCLHLAAALAAGGLLRLWNLRAQVMGGDELHSLRQAVSVPVRLLLTRHTDFDHGRSLTALFRLGMDAGLRFDELTFRLPVLASGFALLLLVSLSAARVLGRPAAVVLAWLLALSPSMVLYSRVVRTYAPVALLAFLALVSFWLWMRSGRARHAAAYAACAVLAAYTHLLSTPFVLAPLLFALGERAWRRSGVPAGRLAGLGLVTVGLTVLVHVPLLEGLRTLAARRASQAGHDLETLRGTLGMQAGTAWPAGVAAFWLAALVGAWRAARRRPRLALYVCLPCALQTAAILVLEPIQSDKPLVFNRYLLVCTPFVLAAVAYAFGAPGRAPVPRLAAGLVLVAGLFAAGPLASHEFRHSSFVHHNRFLFFADERVLPQARPPEPYGRLSGEGAIVEFPWSSRWSRSVAPMAYQRVHGREVVVAGRDATVESPRLALRNAVPLDRDPLAALLASRGRFLVLHHDMGREELRFHTRDRLGEERGVLRRMAASLAGQLERAWGPPALADEEVAIWDLELQRERGARAAQRIRDHGR